MNVLAIVPARGGSKGVPGKNIRPCGGKPLLAWSVEAALASKHVGMVVVSSDDPEILAAGRIAGAIGQERVESSKAGGGDYLSGDVATLDDVAHYVVQNLAGFKPDVVVTLQPTCPIRRPGLIDDCIQRLYDTDADSVFTARGEANVWWREDSEEWAESAVWRTSNPRMLQRQEFPARSLRWVKDGSVVVTRVDMINNPHRLPRLIGGRVQPYPNDKTVDIDTEQDLLAAGALLWQGKNLEAIA